MRWVFTFTGLIYLFNNKISLYFYCLNFYLGEGWIGIWGYKWEFEFYVGGVFKDKRFKCYFYEGG